MEKPWTEIMSKQEMVEYLRGYLKQRGYKSRNKTGIGSIRMVYMSL